MRFTSLLLLAAAVLPLSGMAAGNTFPNRPVTIIVTYPPGGTADIATRIVAQQLTESLGQPFVVDNRAGAGGAIGWAAAARSAPDGYTLVALDTAFAMAPSIVAKLPIDPSRDFVHVSGLGAAPFVMFVPPTPQPQSVKEFVGQAKANPGKLNYGSGGIGNSAHIVGEWFSSLAGVRLTHVPYKGGAPMNQAVMSGEVQVAFSALPAALGLLKAEKVRALMVTSEKRLPQLPDVPSAPEAGLPKMIGSNWFTIAAPAKTPPEIVAFLGKAIAEAVNQPGTSSRFLQAGLTPMATTPAQTEKLVKDDSRRWAAIIKAAGIKAE